MSCVGEPQTPPYAGRGACTIGSVQAFYTDHFVLPLPDGHRFPMAKYAMLRDLIAQHLAAVRLQAAEPADEDALALAHDRAYIEAVRDGTLTAAQQREIGFPWSPSMYARAVRSVGATVQACRVALSGEGIAANVAGGTHHAYADKGSGFCVFNDAAVAARLMQIERLRAGIDPPSRPLQVAIIDLDVHQGNGSAHIFHRDPSVFTLSLHGARNFPFRKEASDCDIDLPDGCADDAYLAALERGLAEIAQRCEPGLLIYLAGADPHEGDRLGRLKLTDAGMATRDQRVLDWAWQHRVPLAMAMAGGYGRDIHTTVRVQLNTYRLALSAWTRWQACR